MSGSMVWRRDGEWDVLLPAADRPAAAVAAVIVLDAEPDALREQLEDQVVDPEWHRHVVFRLRKVRRRLRGDPRDVAGPVFPGSEEERADDDARRAALDAPRVRRPDRRLGQLHVRGFDDVVELFEP